MLWSDFITGLDAARSEIRSERGVKNSLDPKDPLLDQLSGLIERARTGKARTKLIEVEIDDLGNPILPIPVMAFSQLPSKHAIPGEKVTLAGYEATLTPREGGYVSRPPVLEEATEETVGLHINPTGPDDELSAIVGEEHE